MSEAYQRYGYGNRNSLQDMHNGTLAISELDGGAVSSDVNSVADVGRSSNGQGTSSISETGVDLNVNRSSVVIRPLDIPFPHSGTREQSLSRSPNRVYKLVLTGGPCAGKTTGQNRVSDFFENLGWQVYRVPETANILLGGGVKFAELTPQGALDFQENLIKTMLAIENTYFDLAEACPKNCLIICDRGIMDATTFITPDEWVTICKKNNWKTCKLRDKRYDHG